MKKSVQIYSIRKQLQEDIGEAFKIISEIGYEGVELALISVNDDVKLIKSLLDKYNLKVSGTHIQIDELAENPKKAIDFYKFLGCERLIIPYYDVSKKENVYELIEKMKKVAPIVRENGMRLYYHNHDGELAKIDGVPIIDIIAQSFSSEELWLEFDVFWVKTGGADPIYYLEKYKDRLDLFHAKDGVNRKGGVLGKGEVDIASVFKKAMELNLEWAVVESEASEDKFEQIQSIKDDFAQLEKFM